MVGTFGAALGLSADWKESVEDQSSNDPRAVAPTNGSGNVADAAAVATATSARNISMTQTGINATVKWSNHWTTQVGLSGGCEASPGGPSQS